MKEVEASQDTQALVLSSALPSTFSAGLDLSEMYQPENSRLKSFWKSHQQLYMDLYGSRLACIAALDGHAPAAGCMLALCCDYRIMSSNPKYKIGLNETKFGISAPPFLARQMIDTIGRRPAELAMTLGSLFSPQEALDLGLVDEVVDNVSERAQVLARELARIPPAGRVATKRVVRQQAIGDLVADIDQDLDNFVRMVEDPQTQHALGAYFESLKKKSK